MMPDLFLIIVRLGVIGGTVGTLPYDMAECNRRAAEMTEQTAEAWGNPATAAKLRAADPRMGPDSMTFHCREVVERPKNGTPWVRLQR